VASDYKYFVFISYSHADERWSRWLHRTLETYRVPKRLIGRATDIGPVPGRLVPVFRDRDELSGAADLKRTVTAALQDSRNLIVICSPAAARSRWVDEEVRSFKRMGRSDRIFTLIVDGEPNAASTPGQEQQECFTASLRFELEPDGSLSKRPAEPIAADARPGMDGKTNAKLKLIAGLLGTGFDELKQREQRRQQKRLLLITAASLAGTVMTGMLAVTAWLARQDAVRNRDRAEDLIGFMLGDFRQQLEPLGKLELLKNVGDKAMEYFSSLNERDITDESLLRRAEALRQIGDVRLSLGEFGPALDAFQDSLTLSEKLHERSPDNQDWLFALGNGWFWVGNTHWQKGDLEAAVAPMTEYLKAAERLVQLDGRNRKWQLERGYALGSLGALAFARGDSVDAIRQYEAASDVTDRLLEVAPVDIELLRSRIEYHSWLASIRESQGELQIARDLHARTLQFTRDLLAIQPDDRRLWEEEVLRRRLYGNVLLLMGQSDEADRVMRDAVARMRTLIGLDPANASWQRQLASVLEQEARVLRASGHCAAALPMIDEGLEISAGLVDKAADMSVAWLTHLTLRNDKAACLLASGHALEASRLLDAALAETRVPNEKRVDFVAYGSALAMSHYLAGDARAASGQPDGARKQWETGLALLEPRHSHPNYRATRVLLLYALGRSNEAQEIHAQLSAQGYAEPNFVLRTKAEDLPR
jgi:eukaryotic-like serine/threonine-protein kinase